MAGSLGKIPTKVGAKVPERHIGLIRGTGLSRRRSAFPSSSDEFLRTPVVVLTTPLNQICQ